MERIEITYTDNSTETIIDITSDEIGVMNNLLVIAGEDSMGNKVFKGVNLNNVKTYEIIQLSNDEEVVH